SLIAWHAHSQATSNASAASTAGPVLASVVMPQGLPNTPEHGIPITRPGQIPAYTLDDARRYFLAHPDIAGPAFAGSTIDLRELRFMTREQTEDGPMHHGSLQNQVNPGGLVCFMRFSGNFNPAVGISVPDPSAIRPGFMAHTTMAIFDVQTGRMLAWGMYP
ncbi:MAG TPA: hypothetical protein VGR57_06880, partial [Ktedonobacterales bacterium]|nr:hypothetical protein [Ktedonobacterales bacterium]